MAATSICKRPSARTAPSAAVGFSGSTPRKTVRDMGLGSLDSIGLAKASELATQYREKSQPASIRSRIVIKRGQRSQRSVPVPSFDEVAKSYITAHRPSWRSPVHARQWETTLRTYASPVLGRLPVNAITTDHIMRVLEPIWHEKTDTAKRTRGRIETVLNYATVRKFRHGDNPARWTGYLSELLARPSRLAPVEHHAALDYKNMVSSWRSCVSAKASGLLHWSSPY